MKLILNVVLIFLSFSIYASADFILTNTPEMMKKEGVSLEMAPWEDGLRQSTGPGFYEWWYFDAHLDDGSKFVAVLFTKPNALSVGPLYPRVSLTLTKPDGTTINDSVSYKASDFSASKSHCNVKIGNSTIFGDLNTYHVNVVGKKIKANLVFKRIAPSWRHGAGKVYFDTKLEKYMGWVIPIPSGAVSGTISDAIGTTTVKGSGYHDHNWGNYAFYNVFDYWFWGRAHVGDYTIVFFDGVGLKKWNNKHLPILMVAHKKQMLLSDPKQYSISSSQMVQDNVPFGRKYPEQLNIKANRDNIKVDLQLSNPTIIDRDDVLGAIPVDWLSSVLRPYFNPWYLRFESDIEGYITSQAKSEFITGKGIYEMMLLGKANTLRE